MDQQRAHTRLSKIECWKLPERHSVLSGRVHSFPAVECETDQEHREVQLERVEKRLKEKKINLKVSDSAVELLGSLGYDPSYGARPVKRVIQQNIEQNIENELAKGISKGDFMEEDTVFVDTETSSFVTGAGQIPLPKLVFRKLSAQESSAPNVAVSHA